MFASTGWPTKMCSSRIPGRGNILQRNMAAPSGSLSEMVLLEECEMDPPIEFISEDEKGFWEDRGCHNDGDPLKEERYD